jgi:hypothetical protein
MDKKKEINPILLKKAYALGQKIKKGKKVMPKTK